MRSRRNERFGRLYEELGRPARGMIRKAFGQAFSDDEIDDLYANAWLGTLRALERRHEQLSDIEMRRYVLAAVANQASRELRRRGRRPTAPLEAAGAVPDVADLPDQLAARAEGDRLTRDVLGSLPPRRRAVLMFRYGWELAPEEVCALVDGLSPRAYRKEINRGVKEVADRLRMAEAGDWCQQRASLLHAFASGTADSDQRRQAQQHLAHCRACAAYVGELGGRLHDLGGSLVLGGVLGSLAGEAPSLGERLGVALEKGRDTFAALIGRGGDAAEPLTTNLAGPGAAGGAGVAGVAGAIAKLGALGAAGKTVAACLAVGTAAATCVAAGVLPGSAGDDRSEESAAAGQNRPERAPNNSDAPEVAPAPEPTSPYEESAPQPADPGADFQQPSSGAEGTGGASDSGRDRKRTEENAVGDPSRETSPQTQEFSPVGEPVAPPPPAPSPPPAPGGSAGGGSSTNGGSGSSDFGP